MNRELTMRLETVRCDEHCPPAELNMNAEFVRVYDFQHPLDEAWELIPEKGWSFDISVQGARFVNTSDDRAEIYLRPCSIYGDTYEFQFVPARKKTGVFCFGFLTGFEQIILELNCTTGELDIITHEYHKEQPRLVTKVATDFSKITCIRESDHLPGLPYEGSSIKLLLDDKLVAQLGQIDFLPESHIMFGLKGKGEVSLSSFAIHGRQRPRPEFLEIGIWQQSDKLDTVKNVDALIKGVRQAAKADVAMLITPETSLTGLRTTDPELQNRDHIQAALERFQRTISTIKDAPHTLIGYPEWIDGSTVEGANLAQVKVNCHRFVRPDGTLGPMMAKVHSCEEGLWHGRNYNLQRVCGVEVAVGVCHDNHYQDVWTTGVMGGARLCLHPSAGGTPSEPIPDILARYRNAGESFDSYWVRVNADGGSGIFRPRSNRKHPETVIAVPDDLTEKNPTYPRYSTMGDLLAHARIRLWDATGCYPMRTLRSGKTRYETWSRLIPEIQNP